ncbi:unnamed protein product [Lota lota]
MRLGWDHQGESGLNVPGQKAHMVVVWKRKLWRHSMCLLMQLEVMRYFGHHVHWFGRQNAYRRPSTFRCCDAHGGHGVPGVINLDAMTRCPLCDKTFQLPDQLTTHALRYRCLPCEKGFGSNHLMVHGRLHAGERPFPCLQCPKHFITSSCIKRHNGVKPYRCPRCSKDFSQNGNLKKHTTTHQLLA